VGLDLDGVYVDVRTPPPPRAFRSRHFEQLLIPPPENQPGTRFEIVLRDVASGERCATPAKQFVTHPSRTFGLRVELRVELRTVRADRCTYILGTLGQILQAARETGNPVRWW
jgi:hypothetical protein